MAREKKVAKELTLEEKLQQALLPVEEQPYEIPENWCWTNVESINSYSGTSIDPLEDPDTLFELYSVPSSANDYPEIIYGTDIKSAKKAVKKMMFYYVKLIHG